jgi:anti-sigma regulatory factor (Ser/Thr protein kinase)
MTMAEIGEMKVALGEAFANAVEHGCKGLPDCQRHIHVSFFPQATGFTIEVRDHGKGFTAPTKAPQPLETRNKGMHLIRNLVSDVDIERRRGDTVIILHTEYSLTFRN